MKTMRKCRFLSFCLCLGAAAAMLAKAETYDVDITINDKVRYQHVTGFGGFSPSPTWNYWLGNKEMEMLFGDGEDQLGLNILRLYMGNSRNSWSAGVSNAKVAKKYGAFVFASPWSPPASWKSNNSDSKGGRLLDNHYADWANFLNDYYKFMESKGVTIDAVSVQNEPDWTADYQSCIWTGEEMARFIGEYGHLIECKIIAPEAIHFSRNMHEPILKDTDACDRLDIMGGHFYGWDGSSYPLAAQKGKEVWMTEFLINERQQNQGHDINWRDDGFLFARSINDAMLANMSAWVHYSLKRYYGCLGDGTYGTKDNKITKRGYVLSHYAKYVSGTTRVRHSISDASGELTASAYISATGDSLVLMLINPSDNFYDATITLPFLSKGGMEIVTDETDNMIKNELEYDETYMPLVEVSPYSVATYVLEKSGDRAVEGDPEDNVETVYREDFAMYGSSCVPDGWIVQNEEETRHAGDYGLGPRIMAFSSEGEMSHVFYFRSGTREKAFINYGAEPDRRLTLVPGKYRLTYATVGWKSCPTVTAAAYKVNTRIKDKASVTPEFFVSQSGPTQRITDVTDGSLEFTVEKEANYILRWEIPASNGGYNEVLVGDIRLVKIDESGIEDVILDKITSSGIVYDIMGRPVSNPKAPGIYIRDGRKFIKR